MYLEIVLDAMISGPLSTSHCGVCGKPSKMIVDLAMLSMVLEASSYSLMQESTC